MNYKQFAFKYGIKISEIKKARETAIKEASSLGYMDEKFIEETMIELLDADRKCLSSRFISSGLNDFNAFLESLINEEIVSTDFAPDQKPEGNPSYNHKAVTIGQPDEDEPKPEEIKIDSDEV